MRQLLITVPRGGGDEVARVATSHDGVNLIRFETVQPSGEADSVMVTVSNQKVEPLLAALQTIPKLRVTLPPTGVIALRPPEDQASEQASNVGHRSPIEVYLGGLQSIGSWKGFLSYAALAGAVVSVGLFTNTIFLLVAAMLIAPFAGPAMTLALGTARGDITLVGHSVLRYFVSLAVTVGVAAGFAWLMSQRIATESMVSVSEISSVAVLLPLAAGAAGALNLVQSERSSLVSGAAAGVLVAASLAPPAGVIGMAAAIQEWDIARSGLFLIVLQLAGINLAGSLVFRAFGLSSEGVRYDRGRPSISAAAFCISAVVLGGLLWLQFSGRPDLQRATRSQRAAAEIQKVVNESGIAAPVEVNVRFTRADISGQNTLLAVVYVQRKAALPRDEVAAQLSDAIQQMLVGQFHVTPLAQVTVLDPPQGKRPG